MALSSKKIVLSMIGLVFVALFARAIWKKIGDDPNSRESRGGSGDPVPVEVGSVEHGPIEWRRTFSGTLESQAEFVVAPKVGGRVEKMVVDLADPVRRGQVVAELDNEEYVQEVAQGDANLEVARANQAEAVSALEIARRELARVETLQARGVASASQYDEIKTGLLANEAAVKVADAQVTRAEAALQMARIRLGYTTVAASWTGGSEVRYVAESHVDAGDTVSANTPLLSVVELNPMLAVVSATEKEYAMLHPGQAVSLTTDAYPGERFSGAISRVAPVFRENSRQARVEITVDNEDERLKPGMFVRVEAILDRVEDATTIPVEAITRRQGQEVVFVVNPDGETISLRPVEIGIRAPDRVEIKNTDLEGRVITLGQQLLDDGSVITIPADAPPAETPSPEPATP